MAKDYFQDILPPDGNEPRKSAPSASPAPAEMPESDDSRPVPINANPVRPIPPPPAEGERSIRNISMPQRPRSRPAMHDMREYQETSGVPPRKSALAGWWIWALAGVCFIVLGILVRMERSPPAGGGGIGRPGFALIGTGRESSDSGISAGAGEAEGALLRGSFPSGGKIS